MQTIEKALHQPMPFTTGGQTITDRLTAAKHSLAGSQLGKTICKATTEELMAPKKKHLDYLLHCTNEPNVSIPSMANLLIERTQNPNWTVVYKSLITIHNIMCYGNERFSQYLASCNTTFNLGSFLDKGSTQGASAGRSPRSADFTYSTSRNWASLDSVLVGYDMSQHVRRYGKYISEKIYTYRLCAYDFCKVKRGREDGLLRTMNTDKLLKTLPILQNQIDALLEFQVTAGELNNGVINCSFILLFRDLIRLFACYNDGVINLLEKFFDMNRKQCREALDMYKAFLLRLDKVAEFLKVAEAVGIDRGEIPDLTRAPASLLEALEAHLLFLEGGGKAPTPSANHSEQFAAAMVQSSALFASERSTATEDSVKQKYLEEEKERLRMFEEQRKKQTLSSAGGALPTNGAHVFNPFLAAAAPRQVEQEPQGSSKASDDLLSLFDPMPAPSHMATNSGVPVSSAQQPPMSLDPTNPFAQGLFQQASPMMTAPAANPAYSAYPPTASTNVFGADFSRAFGGMPGQAPIPQAPPLRAAQGLDAYAAQPPPSVSPATSQAGKFGGGDLDSALSSLADNLSIGAKANTQGKPVQWNNQGAVRPPMMPHPLSQVPYGQMPSQQWPPMGPYPPQPGMYPQQPMMGVYGQAGYAQVPAAGVFSGAPTQASQVNTAAPQAPQHPFH